MHELHVDDMEKRANEVERVLWNRDGWVWSCWKTHWVDCSRLAGARARNGVWDTRPRPPAHKSNPFCARAIAAKRKKEPKHLGKVA